jgi:hypothetical protein
VIGTVPGMAPIMKGVKSWEEEDAELEARSSESLANLGESLDVEEPQAGEEEVIDAETDCLEKKFTELKEQTGSPIKVTLQVWDPIEGVSNDGMEIDETEFKYVIEELRRKRRGEPTADEILTRTCRAMFGSDKQTQSLPA